MPTPPGLADEYSAGATVQELADRYDVSRPTMTRMLDEEGVPRRSRGDAVYYERMPFPPGLANDYVKNSMSIIQLSEKHGISETTIGRMLEELNVKRRPKKEKIKYPPNLVSDYRSGMTTVELGATHGISPKTIGRMLERLGVERRPGGNRKK